MTKNNVFVNPLISWFDFAESVLDKALDNATPVLERLWYLTDVYSHLINDFNRTKVIELRSKIKQYRQSGLYAEIKPTIQLYREIRQRIKALNNKRSEIYSAIRDELADKKSEVAFVWAKHVPCQLKDVKNGEIYEHIKTNDVLLHFPYHSFKHVLEILNKAADDPSVQFIQATIYRLAPDSQIVKALIKAAQNGKKVSVYIELEARLDEKSNENYLHTLKANGIKIIPKWQDGKVHAKLILIQRKPYEDAIALISTGNWHEGTAKSYSDFCLITSYRHVTNAVDSVFDLLKRKGVYETGFNPLFLSPLNTRDKFLQLIDDEINNKRAGAESWVIIKCNNLTDTKLAKQILYAAECGVKITLIIRGMCIIHPDMMEEKGIKFIRIIDRFLEHSRVFAFSNNGKPRYFISSGDWMPRNLDKRVEISVEIYVEENKKIIQKTLDLQIKNPEKSQTNTTLYLCKNSSQVS